MIQASNELILGIELNENYAQLTYFHASVKEPLTVSAVPGEEQYLLPMAMRQNADGSWELWDGTEEPQAAVYVQDLYRKLQAEDEIEAGTQRFSAKELLAEYFAACIGRLKVLTANAVLQVMVTVRELTERWSSLIVAALERNGLDRKRIYLQDYLSSFYYYTVNQKKELWNHDVALIEYVDEAIVGYILHIDRTTRPAIARAEEVVRQSVGAEVRGSMEEADWDRERDRLFFELLKKLFERRTVTVSYLLGDYFGRSWAERSIQYLCFKRHAYQGQNLYSKGACYAAMERAGLIAERGILFGGRDMIQVNLQMEMRIRGKEQMYPLISAGINWYEAHHVCEFILNEEREIRITSQPMAQGDPVVHMMRLSGLPHRPPRATRVRMTIYFSAPGCCHIEVEDLGFGEFYRSTGMVWKREIKF